ncbi:OLC1v1009108C2 [Oldenlandia corymbosa var. corymbosa]|uniref:OLC1v1009108C2 n=2 Tax=Oldenlandia corymbosa var. corymbosa TaxID=529605 RepID=A0AAV1DQY4_OLDCO|nr:OLC1v1009108C2 [Oldenlandia corymbosa var. corymbosa]
MMVWDKNFNMVNLSCLSPCIILCVWFWYRILWSLKQNRMNSATTHFVASRRMGLYEPIHPVSMWGDFRSNGCPTASASTILQVETNLDNQSEDTSQGTFGTPHKYDQEASKPADKVLRRLAQNREAARKSRLRKKAYVQQLESSKLRLMQLEQELDRARQQGLYASGGLDVSQLTCSGTLNSGYTTFVADYGHWVEMQNKQVNELRNALQSQVTDDELQPLVNGGINHYLELFRLKEMAAKADVFYLLSGMWKTPVERLFLWIGGFRPSDLLKVLQPQIQTLTEDQIMNIENLRQACQQAEDALSQGMDKLLQYLGNSVADDLLGELYNLPQLQEALDNLAALERFVKQVIAIILLMFFKSRNTLRTSLPSVFTSFHLSAFSE